MNKINKIVIVGGGTAGWMAAAALSKVLGCQNYTITLVESEHIGTVGVGEATIPMINLFNRVLGLDENEFVRETNATFKLGIEFLNWGKLGQRYFHPFGSLGLDMDGISFNHFWMRWKKSGGNLDYSKFSAETEAARANKFMRTAGESGPAYMPHINYAFQFDASLYAKFLRRYSESRAVKRVEGKIVEVKQHSDSGFIQSLILQNGTSIDGDFFIDCSGFRGLLIEQTLKAGYHDWSHWLPVNRAAAVPCENTGMLFPYTRATAQEFGWQWRIPLQHRTGNGYVYCDKFITEDAAAEKLLSRLDGKALAEPKTLKFVTGMRKKCWDKNCVAIGLASGFLEPLESTSIHLVQVAIAKLLTMFPRDGISEMMVRRFNHEMSFDYNDVKDLLIAHYKVTEREDTEFWRYVKNMSIPDSLQEKLDTFRTRGDMMVRHDELFKEQSWFNILMGQ
ncbi:MAG: tryptophan halogenase family protein, partial [Cellvibrio sp.]